jgi:translation elongation factor EF-1beta
MEYNVAADIKIYIDGPESVPGVKAEIEKLVKVQRFWEEDVGFGIKVLKATLMMDDSAGGMDKLEADIRKIKGVSELEVDNITRL